LCGPVVKGLDNQTAIDSRHCVVRSIQVTFRDGGEDADQALSDVNVMVEDWQRDASVDLVYLWHSRSYRRPVP
jgi:hypothetical protein